MPPPPIVGNASCTGDFTTNIVAIDSNPLTLTGVNLNSPGGIAVGVATGGVNPISIVANDIFINNTGSGGIFTNTGLGIAAGGGGDATITTNNTTVNVAGPAGGGWAIMPRYCITQT